MYLDIFRYNYPFPPSLNIYRNVRPVLYNISSIYCCFRHEFTSSNIKFRPYPDRLTNGSTIILLP